MLAGVDPSDQHAIAEANLLNENTTEFSSAAAGVEQFINENCARSEGCDPRVDLSVTPTEIRVGEAVTVSMDAHADHGIDFAWWFAESSDGEGGLVREELRPDGASDASDTWTVPLERAGTYTFSANVRDVTYGDYSQDAQRPRQTSEGCGLAEVTVVVN